MLYHEAVAELLAGKFVARKTWEAEIGYLVCLPGLTHFLKVTLQPKSNVVPYAVDIADSMADDWDVIDRAKVITPPVVPPVQH
jgi:hypothetical protein